MARARVILAVCVPRGRLRALTVPSCTRRGVERIASEDYRAHLERILPRNVVGVVDVGVCVPLSLVLPFLSRRTVY